MLLWGLGIVDNSTLFTHLGSVYFQSNNVIVALFEDDDLLDDSLKLHLTKEHLTLFSGFEQIFITIDAERRVRIEALDENHLTLRIYLEKLAEPLEDLELYGLPYLRVSGLTPTLSINVESSHLDDRISQAFKSLTPTTGIFGLKPNPPKELEIRAYREEKLKSFTSASGEIQDRGVYPSEIFIEAVVLQRIVKIIKQAKVKQCLLEFYPGNGYTIPDLLCVGGRYYVIPLVDRN
jgi:hypothetical protein